MNSFNSCALLSVAQEEAQMEHFRSLTGKKKRRMEIWMVLDHPRSSRLALVSFKNYSRTVIIFVMLSEWLYTTLYTEHQV